MTKSDGRGESSEVAWTLDETTLCGTLVRPAGDGPFPAVAMVAGSGPTDRDWNSPLIPGSNGSARLLADELCRSKTASLRYDKRGVGARGAEALKALTGRLSMRSFAEELAGAVRTLAAQTWVRDDRIFAIANSEGTLHALNYQLGRPEIPLAGLVLIAPPGRTVGAVARAQLAEQAAGLPNGEWLLDLYDAAVARFMAGEPAAPDPALPQGVQALLHGLETPVNLPFSRELWGAEAATLIQAVDTPVLVVIGKRDVQVDWQADGALLQRAAAGRADVTFLFPEHANHVLKHEPRPRAELDMANALTTYSAPDARLDPEAAAGILAWLAARA